MHCEHGALRHLGHWEEVSPRERADSCGWPPGPHMGSILMCDHVGASQALCIAYSMFAQYSKVVLVEAKS